MNTKTKIKEKLEKVVKNHERHINQDKPFNPRTHAIVYIIFETVTYKAYVGQTCKTMSKRFQQHCKDAKCKKEPQSKLHPAILKYGKDNFNFLILEIVPIHQVSAKEKEYIAFFNSKEDGYNATIGGEGKGGQIDIKEVERLFKEKMLIKDIARKMNCDRGTVSNILAELGTNPRDNRTKIQGHAVYMCDAKTHEIIKEFPSESDAGRWIQENDPRYTNHKLKALADKIGKVANGERKTAWDYHWKFVDNEENT